MTDPLTDSFGDLTLSEFTKELSGTAPAPGGGAAAALAGALGVSLGCMTVSLAVGKKAYADQQSELKELTDALQELRDKLLACADEDAKNFLPLMQVYKRPASTDAEKKERQAALEAALQKANETPLELMRLLVQGLTLIQRAAKIGNASAISDAGGGARLAVAAAEAASLNVLINAKAMSDKEEAGRELAETEELLQRSRTLADAVFQSVRTQILEGRA